MGPRASACTAGSARQLLDPAAAEQVVDRADQVLDVDDQNRPAVLEHRRAIEVGNLAQPGIEGRDAEVALAQEPINHDPEAVAAIAGDHDRKPAVLPRRSGKLEHLGRLDQADRLVVQKHVRLALQVANVLTIEHQDPVDAVERKGERLAGDLHQQGADHRHGDRKLEDEPGSLAELAADPDGSPNRLDHALHHVEANAPARDLGHLLLGREAGQEQKIEQLGLAQSADDRGGRQPLLDDLGAQPVQVDSPAVVAEDDLEHPRAVASLQPDCPRRVLAGRATLLGHLEPVIQGVADQMIERGLQTVQDVAIDARGLAHDLELHLLAKLRVRRRGPGAENRGSRRPGDASGWPALHGAAGPRGPRCRERTPRCVSSVSPSPSRQRAAWPLALESSSRSAAGSDSPALDRRSSSRWSVSRSPV